MGLPPYSLHTTRASHGIISIFNNNQDHHYNLCLIFPNVSICCSDKTVQKMKIISDMMQTMMRMMPTIVVELMTNGMTIMNGGGAAVKTVSHAELHSFQKLTHTNKQ